MNHRKAPITSSLAAFAALLFFADAIHAAPWNFVGARQQAMGGAGVATTQDSTANYWNPANLAFQKGWGVNLPATVDLSIENDAITELSNLLVSFDQLGASARNILSCQPGCVGTGLVPAQAQGLAGLLAKFATYGSQGEAVLASASLGLAGRYENMGFSALSLTTGTVFPNTDLGNLALGLALLDVVSPGAGCCQAPADAQLGQDVFAAAGGAIDLAESGHLVYLLEQSGADTTNPRVRQLALGLVDPAGGVLSANNTGALTAGLSSQEIAFSYAVKLPFPFLRKTSGRTRQALEYVDKKIALSVVPKYMLGVTFIKFFRYDDSGTPGSVVGGLLDINSSSVSQAFGLDIALAYHPTSWIRVGMMARNVNRPTFDIEPFFGATGLLITSIAVEPQVRMGIAVNPIERLTLAFDVDATSNRIATLPLFESRIVSLGAEYVVPINRHLDVALRLGGYSNVSDTVQDDWAMTGGFGLRAGSFHFDLSAGGSFANEVVRTGTTTFENFPTRLNVGLGLSWEKSL